MPCPIQSLKAKRREQLVAETAAERQAQAAAVKTLTDLLKQDIGDEAAALVTVVCVKPASPLLCQLTVKDHIPVQAKLDGGRLTYTLTRRHEIKTFDHFADALEFGQPYGDANPAPAAPGQPVEAESFDTRPDEKDADGQRTDA